MNKIFVSNLDEKTQEASLIQYFSQFGNIIECYVSKFPDGKCKGFVKVQLSDKEALKKVLSMNHYMDGRNIRVEQFIKNVKDKKKKERELNSRKICVLAIPLHLKDQDLTNIFKMYGPVDGAYIRKSGGGTKNNHGFVTFKHPRVAQEVKELKFVEIFGGYKLKICDVTKSSNKSEGSVQGHDSQAGIPHIKTMISTIKITTIRGERSQQPHYKTFTIKKEILTPIKGFLITTIRIQNSKVQS